MRHLRPAIFTLALVITFSYLCAEASFGQSYPIQRPIVLPGASYVVRPYTYRPSAYGPYYGQGLSAIQPNVTVFRRVPVVTPGTSFLYYSPRSLPRTVYPYRYPGASVGVVVPLTTTPAVPSGVVVPLTPRPLAPTGTLPGTSYLRSPRYFNTQPVFPPKK